MSLSGAQAAARIRIWRSLKASGAAVVRDGVYLVPAWEALEPTLREQRREITHLGGTAFLFDVRLIEAEDEPALRTLFDREEEYASFISDLAELTDSLSHRTEIDARRRLRQLRRDLQSIDAIDYFPGAAKKRAQVALSDAEARFIATFSPGEPSPERRFIPQIRAEDYQGKVWATRARPWVDRVASAWLICRFIDPRARFVWIANAKDCPKDAIGFDFDGAAFTHVDDLVSFEVLLVSFDLRHDAALRRIGLMVRGLDNGTALIPEGAGFESFLGGARDMLDDDDALLKHASQMLDFMYAAFSKLAPTEGSL